MQNTNEFCSDDNPTESDKNGASDVLNEENTVDNNSKEDSEKASEKKESEGEALAEDDEATKEDDKNTTEKSPNSSSDENPDKKSEESKENVIPTEAVQDCKSGEKNPDENNVIDEDDDDYLLYLEDILRRIHAEFYASVEKETGRKSLRDIIPRVRAQVLKGLHLTFSGLIPTHQKLHQSRAYKVARAFGAEVAQVIFLHLAVLHML